MTQTSQSMRPDVISLAEDERVNDVVLGAVLGLWDVVNSLTRLRPSRRNRYRVTIFGSARVTPGSFGYEETRRAAAVLAAMGCDILTGGGVLATLPPRLDDIERASLQRSASVLRDAIGSLRLARGSASI